MAFDLLVEDGVSLTNLKLSVGGRHADAFLLDCHGWVMVKLSAAAQEVLLVKNDSDHF